MLYTAYFKEHIHKTKTDEIDAIVKHIRRFVLEPDRFINKIPLPRGIICGLAGLPLDPEGAEKLKKHAKISSVGQGRAIPY
jgi:hypothetical protein